MHHRMPRSSRPCAPRRRTGVLLASALTVAVAAGGALLLERPATGTATASVALDATSKHSTVMPVVIGQDGAPAKGPATRSAAAPTVGEQEHMRPAGASAAGIAPGMAARDGGAQQSTAAATGGQLADGGQAAQDAAAAANPNCTLVVPPAPTSARGLTTPYQLTATSAQAGACHEANPDQAAFVEAAILDTDTGALSTYRPLVIDAGDQPALAPVPVTIPQHAAVAVWFGFNGDTLTLTGPGASPCVNGLRGSPFGQFAYCNAPAFFAAANAAIAAGKLAVPALGTGTDGLPCPTTRDFSVVDQDQSDNLTTTYRIINGRMAQDTAATQRGKPLGNGSDEGLLAAHIDPALGCQPFTAPDQTNGGQMTPGLALNELSASANQGAGMALVPMSDPMTLVNGRASTEKTNLYRAGVDQPALPAGQNPGAYCAALQQVALARIRQDAALLSSAAAPAAGSKNLLQFLTTRLQATLGTLGCAQK